MQQASVLTLKPAAPWYGLCWNCFLRYRRSDHTSICFNLSWSIVEIGSLITITPIQPANLFSGKPSSTATPYHVHVRRSSAATKSCWFFDPDYRARSRTHIPFSLVRIYPLQILQCFRIVKMRCLSLQAVCLRDCDWHRRCHGGFDHVSGNHVLGLHQEHSLLKDHDALIVVMELSCRRHYNETLELHGGHKHVARVSKFMSLCTACRSCIVQWSCF